MPTTSTGISGLDAQLGGGVPSGSTILLMTDPGNAASIFCEQFAGGGLASGEDVAYFSLDRTPDRVADRVRGFSLNGGIKTADLRVFDAFTPAFRSNAKPTEGVTPIQASETFDVLLKDLVSRDGSRPLRLVIDSLSAVVTDDSEKAALDFVRQLVFTAREAKATTIITVVKGLHSARFETHLKHLVSGVFEMGLERKGFGIYSFLLISKLLDVPDPVRILLFKETDKGLWLESTKRVF